MLALAEYTWTLTRYNVRMWCSDRGSLIGITFTWVEGFLKQRNKFETVLKWHGFLELNFRSIDLDILFDLFGETHLRKVLPPLPFLWYSFLVYLTKNKFFLVILLSESITNHQLIIWQKSGMVISFLGNIVIDYALILNYLVRPIVPNYGCRIKWI